MEVNNATIKCIVGLDSDGHFFCVPLKDREAVWFEIINLDDGDAMANSDIDENYDYKSKSEEEFIEMMYDESFIQRGSMEIVDVDMTTWYEKIFNEIKNVVKIGFTLTNVSTLFKIYLNK